MSQETLEDTDQIADPENDQVADQDLAYHDEYSEGSDAEPGVSEDAESGSLKPSQDENRFEFWQNKHREERDAHSTTRKLIEGLESQDIQAARTLKDIAKNDPVLFQKVMGQFSGGLNGKASPENEKANDQANQFVTIEEFNRDKAEREDEKVRSLARDIVEDDYEDLRKKHSFDIKDPANKRVATYLRALTASRVNGYSSVLKVYEGEGEAISRLQDKAGRQQQLSRNISTLRGSTHTPPAVSTGKTSSYDQAYADSQKKFVDMMQGRA